MDRKRLITIGKWILMALLMASNYMFYLINETMLNLILAILVLAYSVLEFFLSLPRKGLNLGIKLYLFTFYLLAALSLIIGVRSLLTDNIKVVLVSLLLICGDTALILYSVHRLTHPVR